MLVNTKSDVMRFITDLTVLKNSAHRRIKMRPAPVNASRKSQKKVPPGYDLIMDPQVKDSPLLSASVQKELDLLTHSKLIKGNKVALLENGVQSFAERYRMMRKARYSINLQTLIFHSDQTSWKTARYLAKKAKEGVKTPLILAWMSSCDTDPKIYQYMRNAGVEVIKHNVSDDYQWKYPNNPMAELKYFSEFAEVCKKQIREATANPGEFLTETAKKALEYWKDPEEFRENLKEHFPLLGDIEHDLNIIKEMSNQWHMKILSVDGQEAIVGGMNIGSEYENGGTDKRDLSQGKRSYSCEAYMDTDIKLEGPIVGEIDKAFAKNYKYATGKSMKAILSVNPPPKVCRSHDQVVGNVAARHITHRPIEEKDQNIENFYEIMLKHVKKTAYITNAYVLPSKKLRKALMAAAKRGVDVRLLTNSPETNDLPSISYGGRYYYAELLKAGVRIYELQKNKDFFTLHTKDGVFDGVVSTVGSANFDPRSEKMDSENIAVVYDKKLGLKMHKKFKKNLEMSKEITVKDLKETPVSESLLRFLAANLLKDQL